MITVCIWTLRDAMRTVQMTFKIPAYGIKHTSPDITEEVNCLTAALESEKIQEYVKNRAGNDSINPVRDLIEHGTRYPDTRKAFHNYRQETRRAKNVGIVEPMIDNSEDEADEAVPAGHDQLEDYYAPTTDDLDVDEEETYGMADQLMEQAEFIMAEDDG